jgi:hypothetical protein
MQFFTPFDVLLAYIASALSELFPRKNADATTSTASARPSASNSVTVSKRTLEVQKMPMNIFLGRF